MPGWSVSFALVVLGIVVVFTVLLTMRWYGWRLRVVSDGEPRSVRRQVLTEVAATLLAILSNVVLVALDLLDGNGDGHGVDGTLRVTDVGRLLTIGTMAVMLILRCANKVRSIHELANLRAARDVHERAADVLSHVQAVCDRKSNRMRRAISTMRVTDSEWPFLHSCKRTLRDMCFEVRTSVAEAIGTQDANVSVIIAYRYEPTLQVPESDTGWHWVVGRAGLAGISDLGTMIADPRSLWYHLLNDPTADPSYFNDKRGAAHFLPSRRDRLYGYVGSCYGQRIDLKVDKGTLVTAMLFVSTHGVQFVDPAEGEAEAASFERVLANEVLPPFVSLVETELAESYLRRHWDRLRVFCIEPNSPFPRYNPAVDVSGMRGTRVRPSWLRRPLP